MTLLLALLLATPTPVIVQPTSGPSLPPIDFDRFCAGHHAGAYRGLLLSRSVPHVTILCARVDFECYRDCEHPIRHFQGTP
jgi:hypothetical protein